MKRLLLILVLTVATVTFVSSALACGDKFLVNSKNIQQGGMISVLNPGSVLLYRNPNSALAQSALSEDLIKRLTDAGYRVTVIADISEIGDMINSKKIDVVIADYADVPSIQMTSDRPVHFLPVVAKDAKDDAKAAKEQFGAVFKAPARSFTAVLYVDDAVRTALDARKGGEAAASP